MPNGLLLLSKVATSIIDENDKTLTLDILNVAKQDFQKNNLNSKLSENIFVYYTSW